MFFTKAIFDIFDGFHHIKNKYYKTKLRDRGVKILFTIQMIQNVLKYSYWQGNLTVLRSKNF